MKATIGLFAALTIVLTSGCAVVYHPPEGAAVARLNLKSEGNKWICAAGKLQTLKADSSGYADIPAGSRVTIGASYNNYVYNGVSTSCNPKSSIVPEAGQRYYIDFEIEAERCYALIFKEDAASRTGLALDPTFGKATDCLGK